MKQLELEPQSSSLDPKRLLMLVVATSIVMMVYSYFFPPQPTVVIPPKSESTIEAQKLEDKEELKPALFDNESDFIEKTRVDLPIIYTEISQSEQEDKKDRISYSALLSNHGASLYGFTLTDFSEKKDLIKRDDEQFLKLYSKDNNINLSMDSPYEILKKDNKNVTYKHVSKEGFLIERTFEFHEKGQITENVVFKNLSEKPLKANLAFLMTKVKDDEKSASFLTPHVQNENVVFKSDEFKKIPFKDIEKEQKNISNISYIGFDDQYFLTTLIPDYKNDISNISVFTEDKIVNIEIDLKPIVLMPKEEKKLSSRLFMGPKQVDVLSSLNPSLEENVEFGWLSILCKPMLWMLIKINDYIGNFGLAIILFTILIKLLTYPLTKKSFTSQGEMKKIAPKIKEIQKKYSHDRSLLGQKQMELYREHGINPMAGCLPLLIQLPIWFAFYRMLGFSVELYDMPFFGWIHDLTLRDPYYVLPIFMGASMLITQVLTPVQMDQPEMKYVMWGMPIFFTFIMLNMPSGLSLYILTNNLLTIAQQMYIKYRQGTV